MSASDYIIAPLPLPPGPSPITPVRQDLNTYRPSTDGTPSMMALFIEAMQSFMQMGDLDDELSYFRVAAIHGAPYVGWGRCVSPGKGYQGGNFCVHNNVTFPTFHRVYMMLFEQRLYEIMGQIVATKPASEQPQWKALWQSWRLPTWHWGTPIPKGEYSVPDVYMIPNWPPTSQTPNPLWKFINPVKDSSGNPVAMGSLAMKTSKGDYRLPVVKETPPTYWDQCQATSRYAPPYPDQNYIVGTNNYVALNNMLNKPQWYDPGPPDPAPTCSITELVFRMLTTNYTNYASFASTKWYGALPAAEAISLEYIHNNIHNFTGGNGHMGDVSVAAFDPIFWQHHGYIDELFAIWQALPQNKSHWFDKPFPPQQGIPADPLPTDPIEPFNSPASRLYNSNDVQSIAALNYDYDFPKDPEELAIWVNRTFGISRSIILNRASNLAGNKNSYIANVIYDKYAFHGSYQIYFFFGEVSIDIKTSAYHEQKNYVGIVATLGSRVEYCANCEKQKQEGSLSRAQITFDVPLLNIALDTNNTLLPRNNFQLGVEDDDGIWNFLKNNLSYKVVDPAGEVVQNNDERLEDLKVTVLAGKATHYQDETKLSEFEDYRSLFTIHKGEHVDEDPWNTPKIADRALNFDD